MLEIPTMKVEPDLSDWIWGYPFDDKRSYIRFDPVNPIKVLMPSPPPKIRPNTYDGPIIPPGIPFPGMLEQMTPPKSKSGDSKVPSEVPFLKKKDFSTPASPNVKKPKSNSLALSEALVDPKNPREKRLICAELLKSEGAKAEDALPILKAAPKDSDDNIVDAIRETIAAIERFLGKNAAAPKNSAAETLDNATVPELLE